MRLELIVLLPYYIRVNRANKFNLGGIPNLKKNDPKTTLGLCALAFIFLGVACGGAETTEVQTSTPTAPSPTAETRVPEQDIAGDYSVTGTNEGGGGEYRGDLRIAKREGVYQFTWVSGPNTYDGVGVRTGDKLAVSFTDGANGKGCGVVLYSIAGDGSLDGKVGYWGMNEEAKETAKRTSGSGLEGSYDISGSNPNGSSYKGKLSVSKQASGYTFSWDAGTVTKGFGVRDGNTGAVGIGGSQCAFVSYRIGPDGTLDGRWGSPGTTTVGTEIAKKK